MKIKAGIIGATGYTGEELIKTLQHHSDVELVFATSNSAAGQKLSWVFPTLLRWGELTILENEPEHLPEVDVVFLCLPAGESFKFVTHFVDRGIRIIDLGPDFRFSEESGYEKWYKSRHPFPSLLRKAAYGLPEFFRNEIRDAAIVANPGCYPTSVLLGVIPLLMDEIIYPDCIIADSKSGLTGAGKTPSSKTHFVNVNENINLYSPGRSHRHVGEMEEKITLITGKSTKIIFNPQIIPVNRGILSCIYCKLRQGVDLDLIYDTYVRFYNKEPFVKLKKDSPPDLRIVQNTNYCYIHILHPENTQYITIISVIDNLGKGASKQAVQNLNIMFGLEEETCLT